MPIDRRKRYGVEALVRKVDELEKEIDKLKSKIPIEKPKVNVNQIKNADEKNNMLFNTISRAIEVLENPPNHAKACQEAQSILLDGLRKLG